MAFVSASLSAGEGQVKVSWEWVGSEPNAFKVYIYRTDPGGAEIMEDPIVMSGSLTTWTSDGGRFVVGKVYRAQVEALDSDGNSIATSLLTSYYTHYALDKPTVVLVQSTKTPGVVTVDWVSFQSSIDSFNIYFTNTVTQSVDYTFQVTDSSARTYQNGTALAAGTYSVTVSSYNGTMDMVTTSDPYQNTITIQGGGGGGGGGGNNGGNGYNMAVELEYNYPDWAASVTQTNTITVLGEDSGALTVNETIVVHVPLSKLKECIVYDSNWTPATGEADGTQGGVGAGLPKIAFRPSETYAAKTELDAMFAQLKAKGTGTVGDRTFNDDAPAAKDCFGKILITEVSFSGSVFDSQDLPKVAIRSIVEGDISVDELTATVTSVDTENNSTHKAYLEGLFEQLVAADRIKGSDGPATDASWGPAKKPSLGEGDSISFKVKYSFTKTREYEVDGLDAGNGNTSNKALTLTIGGSTFTIQTGVADGSEVSQTLDKTYEFKLVAIAD